MNVPERRRFLRVLAGAGVAPAVAACSRAPERILPYVIPPEDSVPGVASFYASVCGECPAGCGMLVRTREGRAVKVEGNPEHPASRGALCVRGHATLQGTYNPDRFRGPMQRLGAGRRGPLTPASWEAADALFTQKLAAARVEGKAPRVAFVTPLLTGALDRLVDAWMRGLGGGRRLRYEPFAHEAIREANRRSFGRAAVPFYDLGKADVIVSFGADILETWLSNVAHAKALRDSRRRGAASRFVHVEPRRSLTAANADEWLAPVPGSELFLALSMAHVILAEALSPLPKGTLRDAIDRATSAHAPEAAAARTGIASDRIRDLARRFAQAPSSIAVGGGAAVLGSNATATQIAINVLNVVAGNVGKTVVFNADAGGARPSTYRDLLELVEAMKAGEIDLLLLHQVNPAFTLPRSAGFASAAARVPFVVSFSSFPDETSALADLVLPTHTPLEAWGDHETSTGVIGLQQPAMEPLFDTRHLGDLLLGSGRAFASGASAAAFEAEAFSDHLRAEWQKAWKPSRDYADFDAFWSAALQRGGDWRTAKAVDVALLPKALETPFEPAEVEGRERGLTLMLSPSLQLYDGRGANRPWLQEIPDPMTKVAWGNWAELHPAACRRLHVANGQLVSLRSAHGRIELTVVESEHVRPDVVAVPLGQGHVEFGRYAEGRGPNPLDLLGPEPEAASGGPRFLAVAVEIAPLPVRRFLVVTQPGDDQAGREIAQAIPLSALGSAPANREHESSMYAEHEHEQHRWGMAIDLDACNGCNACVAACYSENNLAVVGPEQMARGRDMSWLRIDRFVERGRDGTSEVRFAPLLCQHCDHAPCESVCPVYATYHNEEGLNAQVYNRCVGTRYCSNNCPYKVRHFNWLEPQWAEPLHLQLNPDVTPRSKGVMEKCSFCIQRIHDGKGRAKDEGRSVRDADITPACAQSCPSDAIVFGDLKDPDSRVSELARDGRAYHVLGALNTRPAVTYLRKLIRGPGGAA